MPFARNSLDLIICSSHPDIRLDLNELQQLRHEWCIKGWIDENGFALAEQELIPAGFHRLIVEPPDKIRLYANHQGGYRVDCSHCFANAASVFTQAVQLWRAGGQRAFECRHCQRFVPLEEARLRPNGAFSQGALWFRDVDSAQLTPQAQQRIRQSLGETQIVLRRLS